MKSQEMFKKQTWLLKIKIQKEKSLFQRRGREEEKIEVQKGKMEEESNMKKIRK